MLQSRDEMVRIILNKAAKPWNDLSEDSYLPAVIARDPRSLKRADSSLPKRVKPFECENAIFA
jgi:hypothetical protein